VSDTVARKRRRRRVDPVKAGDLPPIQAPPEADRPTAPVEPADSHAPVEPADAHEPVDEHPEGPSEPERPAGPVNARLATADELADWDTHAVASLNGHVYQSRAWADYRATHGWHTWHVAFDDGFRMLVLGRPRSTGAAAVAYASRGPIPEDDPALSAQRAVAVSELVANDGVAALTVDAETPAATGLAGHLAIAGFEPVEEEQPARHRMDVRLGPDDAPNSDEKTIFASFGATTRNAIRQADRHGLRVRRLDAGGGREEEEYGSSPLEEFDPIELDDAEAVDGVIRTFYGMLDTTERQRRFETSSAELFLDWSRRSIAAGHALYLQADHPHDGPIAGAMFYRHGHRLTYALAGVRGELRRAYPGASRMLIWRGIQIALDERRLSVDLGGVDVVGARSKPDKGDPTYDAYQVRESFGARWLELTGAHRRTMRPITPDVGNAAARALRLLGRISR
jgi:lipid II:glycine glycyltransferase (peptidoglycan interpeptide bridge formation enzyme)